MRLVRARVGPDDRICALLIAGDTAVELPVPPSIDPWRDLLTATAPGADLAGTVEARRAAVAAVHPTSELRVLAPVHRPGKIIAIGLNYADHTAETGLAAPTEPLTFAKYPSSIIGPDEPIVVRSALTAQVDWEAELALVIGRRCGPGEPGTMQHIAGYTVANDISARDLQFGDKQWTRGKSLDTFCPLGPALVTSDEIADPHKLRIWTTVNDQTMQDASTADLIFDIPALLEAITAGVTLEPGDVVLTGTPPGVGGFRTPPVFLQDGDVVTVGVDGVGELRNPVRVV